MGSMQTNGEGPDGGPYLSGEIVFVPLDAGPRAVSVIQPARREDIRNAWLLSVKSTETRKAYRADTDQYFAWADEFGIDPLRPTQYQADGYREYLQVGQFPRRGGKLAPYSDATVARKLVSASSFLRYGSKHYPHDVPANAMANVDRPVPDDESTSTGLDLDAAGEFVDAAEKMGPREYALALLFLGTGLRVSGIANASASDLGEQRGTMTLTVRIKGGKRTTFAVPNEAADALRAYLGDRTDGPLFQFRAEKPSRQVIAHAIDRIGRAAGLGALKIGPHDLRHTMATLALDEGQTLRDVQDQLRHKYPRTTHRYDRGRGRLDRSAGRTVTSALARVRGTR